MTKTDLKQFLKPTILKILVLLCICYVTVPVFATSSLCLDRIAKEPKSPIYPTLPCVKLTTLPQYLQPTYKTENGTIYQQNAIYSYDLTTRFTSPMINILFGYITICIIFSGITIIRKIREKNS